MNKSGLVFIVLVIAVITVSAIKDARCPDYTSIYDLAAHLPHDKNCSQYYVCDHDHTIIENNCPSELEFNPKLSVCDYVGVCALAPLQPLSNDNETESDNYLINTFDNECPIDEDPNYPTLLPDKNDCTSFFKCSNGVPVAMKCPPGLHWNIELNYCDYPENAHCVTEAFM